MLVLGAQLGVLFSGLCGGAFPGMKLDPIVFAVVGMAAFFTGVVQAPVTGIILAVEMTASFQMLLPMIAASFVAMVIQNLLDGAPIYDTRTLRLQKPEQVVATTRTPDPPGEYKS
jgi:CIC family chloride channel protein